MTQEQAIEEIARRLVTFYQPERIYLFGSAARGDCGPDSDLDFCVVLPDDAPEKLMRTGAIYSELRGVGYPTDVIPWRSSDFDARGAHVVASRRCSIASRQPKKRKAFLTFHQTLFRKTHVLGDLSPACVAIDGSLAAPLDEITGLTKYAWQFRYPGAPYEPDAAEATDALQRAELAVREIERRLPPAK